MKKIDFKAVVSAVAAGGGYNFAIEGMAKRVDFVNNNYLVVKSLGAGLLGSSMIYFGKNEASKAAGYALLGVAGASGASKLSTVMVSTVGEPMQGVQMSRLKKMMSTKRGNRGMFTKFSKPGAIERGASNMTMARPNQTACTPYAAMAFNDLIY